MSDFMHGTVDGPPDFDLRFHKLIHLMGDIPDGFKAQTFPRNLAMLNAPALVSGRENLTVIILPKGFVVNSITFYAAAGASVTPTNLWLSLRDKSRRLLGITNDNGAGVWTVTGPITLNLVTPYTVPVTDFYYIGIMNTATTCPGLMARQIATSTLTNMPLPLGGVDNTNIGLTTPATAPAISAVLTGSVNQIYGLVS